MDGKSLLQKAQKTESSASGGFSFFGSSKQDKLEQAIDEYVKAANAFRTSGYGREAGETFERAAALSKTINEPNDAANYLTEAFKCYKRDSIEDAARVLTQAIEYYALTNVRRAATNKQTLAELLGDPRQPPTMRKQAIAEYEQAGEWFQNDNAEALANKCFIGAADVAASVGEYNKAIKLYETVATASISHNLLKWSVKEYLFKAGLCHLATQDLITARKAITYYPELDPSFRGTQEGPFLYKLLELAENGDPDGFSDCVRMTNDPKMSVLTLDDLKNKILVEALKGIQSAGDDLT